MEKANMLDKVLTVIVPSYNVEAYLPETIPTFLRNEVLSKVEVLIVNDGSKDRTCLLYTSPSPRDTR